MLSTAPHHRLQNPLPGQRAEDHLTARRTPWNCTQYLPRLERAAGAGDWPSARPDRRAAAAAASSGPLRTWLRPTLASAPRVGRETGTPAICRLEAWPDGTSEARRVLPAPPLSGRVLAARPGLGQPDPAWPVAAARPGGSLHFGAGLRGLHGTKRKGLSPACEGPEWDQRSPFSLLPVPRIRWGDRMGARGGPIKPEEAQQLAPGGGEGRQHGVSAISQREEKQGRRKPVQTPRNWKVGGLGVGRTWLLAGVSDEV